MHHQFVTKKKIIIISFFSIDFFFFCSPSRRSKANGGGESVVYLPSYTYICFRPLVGAADVPLSQHSVRDWESVLLVAVLTCSALCRVNNWCGEGFSFSAILMDIIWIVFSFPSALS